MTTLGIPAAFPAAHAVEPAAEPRVVVLGVDTHKDNDPRLCAAIVDRLTFGGNIIESGNIIETGTESYRLASTRAARAQDAAG